MRAPDEAMQRCVPELLPTQADEMSAYERSDDDLNYADRNIRRHGFGQADYMGSPAEDERADYRTSGDAKQARTEIAGNAARDGNRRVVGRHLRRQPDTRIHDNAADGQEDQRH